MNINTKEKGKQVTMLCGWCDKKHTYLYKSGRRRKFCSKKCADKSNHKKQSSKYHKKCQGCGIDFRTSDNKARFCSSSCAFNTEEHKECLGCGKSFKGVKSKKYCSHECRKEKRVCPICKSVFKSLPHSETKYCSSKCYGKSITFYLN